MEEFASLIRANDIAIVLVAVSVSMVTFLLWIITTMKMGRLQSRYNKLMQGIDGKNLDERLTTYIQSVNKALAKTEEVGNEYKIIRKMARNSIQNVGMVRFNAFDDTGSDLSFALALLDHSGDGLVISSLFGRAESRIYAKAVSQGASSHNLSQEEQEAIRKALASQIMS